MDDGALLSAWRAGDRQAGDELIQRHFSSVLGFFRRKLGADVEDLVQHTFLECLEHSERIDAPRFRVFLFTIAHRRLMDHLRRLYRRSDDETLSHSMADLATSARTVIARNEQVRLLLLALDLIPLEQRFAIELAHFDGLPHNEIAEVLEISPNTVRSRLSRARSNLRDHVEKLSDSPALAKSALASLG